MVEFVYPKKIGRERYLVHGQGPTGKYPRIIIPKEAIPTGAQVEIFQVVRPGAVLLEVGDLVVKTIPESKGRGDGRKVQ